MARALTPEDLERAVIGDMAAFSLVSSQPQQVLLDTRSRLHELVLHPEAVRSVLSAVISGDLAPQTAQAWASFVRRGFVAGTQRGPVKPIDIAYDLSAEEQIVDIIARLDELGDAMDGEITRVEGEALLSRLR